MNFSSKQLITAYKLASARNHFWAKPDLYILAWAKANLNAIDSITQSEVHTSVIRTSSDKERESDDIIRYPQINSEGLSTFSNPHNGISWEIAEDGSAAVVFYINDKVCAYLYLRPFNTARFIEPSFSNIRTYTIEVETAKLVFNTTYEPSLAALRVSGKVRKLIPYFLESQNLEKFETELTTAVNYLRSL